MLFTPKPAPRIFALPVGCDFSMAFIDGLRARMAEKGPEDWARITILVNTRRAQRRLVEILSSGPPCLLPDIRVISDIGAAPGLPVAESRFLRHLALADMVAAYMERTPGMGAVSASFGLAEALAELLDEMIGEGVEFAALQKINPQGLSGHWQDNLRFLNILNDYLDSLPGDRLAGAQARQKMAVEKLVSGWESTPPKGPVILAGSTGSRRVTCELMAAVAGLAEGAVVLPGFDFTTPKDLWAKLEEEHPQFGFAILGKKLGFDPAEVPVWQPQKRQNHARNRLVSLALRPAPVTPHWLEAAPKLSRELPEACTGLTLLNAPDIRMEATAIATRLREALAMGQKAALVTPDRTLARRVGAQLGRWNILPDDSAGHPAKLTPPGVFLRMVATALGRPPTPVNLMEILKHPLCSAADKDSRKAHLALARQFEAKALRGGPPQLDLRGFARWRDKQAEGSIWLDHLADVFAPMESAAPRPVADWASLHRQVAEALAGEALWAKEAGREVIKVFDTLALGAGHKTLYSATQYRALFATVLEQLEVRDDPLQAHPGIAIWGTLEARVQAVDLLIVAGLNEGVWPKISNHDPWLNRDMRRQAGLMLPERQIGLSAHDFQQALGAAEVVISRSLRDGEAPSVASRWLMRLQNLIGGMEGGKAALEAMEAKGARLLALATTLDRPEAPPQPAPRPCPAPPLAARPRKLSVTSIETLIRDPYALYARHILKLYPLDPLTPEPDPRLRGTLLHDALERFVKNSMDGLPKDPEALYDQCVDEVLEAVPWASTKAMWRHHYLRARGFFLEGEAARRMGGTPFNTEILGQRVIKGREYDLTLTAKADRIDITASGGAIIYDYKTGNPETIKQIRQFNVQLPLEGMIAEAQGFEGLNAGHVGGLELIYLGRKTRNIVFGADDPVMDDVWQRVVGFINRYQARDMGYAARLRPELIQYEGDYDHLSRRGEWQDDDPAVTEVLP